MRKPERIPRIAKKFETAWKLVPDWRMGQLLSNLFGPGPHDIFFPEDDDWEKKLDNFIEAFKKEKK